MQNSYLITGGAGFIGSNYTHRLLSRGEQVAIFDNLSRPGAEQNLKWLRMAHGKGIEFYQGDIRDMDAVKRVVEKRDIIIHLAGQVAVTTSVDNPREDFEINAAGTLNMLEACRTKKRQPILIYASTNKVYGGMEDLRIREDPSRYSFVDLPNGINETRPLDFHSPYGCSKGCGDQYVRDFARIYELPTVVFRQSCIYGKRQFGIEDQGWVAWFIIAAALGKTLSIYGDGKQVRDLLFVEDLLDAYDLAITHIEKSAGQIFNIGGGLANTVSVWKEFQPILESSIGKKIKVKFNDWRPGDQKVYYSDIHKAKMKLGWIPRINIIDGVNQLSKWVCENINLFKP